MLVRWTVRFSEGGLLSKQRGGTPLKHGLNALFPADFGGSNSVGPTFCLCVFFFVGLFLFLEGSLRCLFPIFFFVF